MDGEATLGIAKAEYINIQNCKYSSTTYYCKHNLDAHLNGITEQRYGCIGMYLAEARILCIAWIHAEHKLRIFW